MHYATDSTECVLGSSERAACQQVPASCMAQWLPTRRLELQELHRTPQELRLSDISRSVILLIAQVLWRWARARRCS